MNIKQKIVKACNKKKNEEVCGFIIYQNEQFEVYECENKAQDKEGEFYIPAKEFLYIKNNFEIVAVYHSHIKSEENASEFDKKISNLVCFPFVVYSYQTQKFSIFKPEFLDCSIETVNKLEEAIND